ncbi:ABC transporter permease [Candidatus Bipolaricaulota bacterium]
MNGTIARMAWRNLRRHPQRTILMIATVGVGSLFIVGLFGLTDGAINSLTATQIDWNQGDFQVRSVAYAADPLPENALSPEQASAATNVLANMDLEAIAPRMEASGMVRTAYGTDGVILRGIDPASEIAVTHLDELITEGDYLDSEGQILLSDSLAEDLDVRLGERVVIVAIGAAGAGSRAFTTVGLFQSPGSALDQVAMASIDDVRSLTGFTGATTLAVALPPGASASRSITEARELLATHQGVQVADYFDLNPFARLITAAPMVRMLPYLLMISLMAGFGVANTTFYSVLERTREFGVMAAVGMSRKLLARMVLVESTMVASIGFLLGGGLGYWFLFYLSTTGWDLSMFSALGSSIGLPRVIYASTSGWYWLAAFSVVVFTALAASWYPARRVNRLEPVTAIREG